MKRGDSLTGEARRAHDAPVQMVQLPAHAICSVLFHRDLTDYVIPAVAADRLAAPWK